MSVAKAELDRLVQEALEVRQKAHAVYSEFQVGAAILRTSRPISIYRLMVNSRAIHRRKIRELRMSWKSI